MKSPNSMKVLSWFQRYVKLAAERFSECTRQKRCGPIRNKQIPDLLLNEAGAADVEYSVGVDADLDLDLLGASIRCGTDFH